jgi:hypothetical protein
MAFYIRRIGKVSNNYTKMPHKMNNKCTYQNVKLKLNEFLEPYIDRCKNYKLKLGYKFIVKLWKQTGQKYDCMFYQFRVGKAIFKQNIWTESTQFVKRYPQKYTWILLHNHCVYFLCSF